MRKASICAFVLSMSSFASVAYADLGDAVDLRDSRLVYDGMHLTSAGNERIARQLVGPVVRLMPEAFTR